MTSRSNQVMQVKVHVVVFTAKRQHPKALSYTFAQHSTIEPRPWEWISDSDWSLERAPSVRLSIPVSVAPSGGSSHRAYPYPCSTSPSILPSSQPQED